MGQEVKNPLRAQSKYGLMGSSAKTGKKIFRGSPEHFLHKNAIWDRAPPPTSKGTSRMHVNVCRRVQGSQIFKRNSIISICSKVMAFLVISFSPWSHIVPVIPTLSPSSPHHPHSPQKVPMWSSWLCSPWSPPHVVPLVPMVPMLSPCHPHCPHAVPVSSPHRPHSPQKIAMWSPWLWSPWSPPHVVPVVLWSPSRPRHPHVIPTSSRRSPHHPQPTRYPVHPPPPPGGVGGPKSVKMQ